MGLGGDLKPSGFSKGSWQTQAILSASRSVLPAGQSCALSPGDGADIKRSAIPCGEVIKDLFHLLVKIIRHTQLLFRGSV